MRCLPIILAVFMFTVLVCSMPGMDGTDGTDGELVFEITSDDVVRGQEVEVTITITENTGVMGYLLDITYDSDALQFVERNGPLIMFGQSPSEQQSKIRCQYDSTNESKVTGTYMVLKFRAIGYGETRVGISVPWPEQGARGPNSSIVDVVSHGGIIDVVPGEHRERYLDRDGSVIVEFETDDAGDIVVPVDPAGYYVGDHFYVFSSWDDHVAADGFTEHKPVYTKVPKQNVVTLMVGKEAEDYSIDWSEVAALNMLEGAALDLSQYSVPEDGFTFDGWYSDSGRTIRFTSDTVPEDDIVLYGVQERQSYPVKYHMPTGVKTYYHTVGSHFDCDVAETSLEGYTFNGWFEDSAHTVAFGSWVMPDGILDLYPRYDMVEDEPVGPDDPVRPPEKEPEEEQPKEEDPVEPPEDDDPVTPPDEEEPTTPPEDDPDGGDGGPLDAGHVMISVVVIIIVAVLAIFVVRR